MTQTYTIEPVHNTLVNLHGWRIVRSDGAVLLPFPTKQSAERLVQFFSESVHEHERGVHQGGMN